MGGAVRGGPVVADGGEIEAGFHEVVGGSGFKDVSYHAGCVELWGCVVVHDPGKYGVGSIVGEGGAACKLVNPFGQREATWQHGSGGLMDGVELF